MIPIPPFRLKFIADNAFVQELKAYAAEEPDNLKIESESRDEDATRLGFDLTTVAAVVAILSGSVNIGMFAAKVYVWLQKSKANKIVIQTPFQKIDVYKSSEMTEEQLRQLLEDAHRR